MVSTLIFHDLSLRPVVLSASEPYISLWSKMISCSAESGFLWRKLPQVRTLWQCQPSQWHCPRGKSKEAGMKGDSGLPVFSLSSWVFWVPKAPATFHSAACPEGTLLCIPGAALIFPAPHSGVIGAYILMKHHQSLISAQSSWTFQLAEVQPEERRGKY